MGRRPDFLHSGLQLKMSDLKAPTCENRHAIASRWSTYEKRRAKSDL
jgi:hypothetical protein